MEQVLVQRRRLERRLADEPPGATRFRPMLALRGIRGHSVLPCRSDALLARIVRIRVRPCYGRRLVRNALSLVEGRHFSGKDCVRILRLLEIFFLLNLHDCFVAGDYRVQLVQDVFDIEFARRQRLAHRVLLLRVHLFALAVDREVCDLD